MAAQDNQSEPGGKPRPTEGEAIPLRPEPLGLEDLTEDERAEAGSVGGEGGLGFDDLSDAEQERLATSAPGEGGLGFDDTMVILTDEEDERAA
jgi:hypothetical protein